MSEETNKTVVTESPETPDREFDVEARGTVLTLIETTHKRGRAKGNLAYFIKLDMSKPDPFVDIKKLVGEENWNRSIMESLVRPNCNDATHEAINPETGEVSDTSWINAFAEQFLPGTRRSGTGIKQLREKLQEIMKEIEPFMMKIAKKQTLTEEENNRYLNLVVQYADLQEKIEGKSRKGKKSKKEAVAV